MAPASVPKNTLYEVWLQNAGGVPALWTKPFSAAVVSLARGLLILSHAMLIMHPFSEAVFLKEPGF